MIRDACLMGRPSTVSPVAILGLSCAMAASMFGAAVGQQSVVGFSPSPGRVQLVQSCLFFWFV